ncbi:DUF2252 family protein [Paraburkholderia strydomiana]|uniref:DUF2252 family protein n=1 Tax=Paraburkholderia strydomiana TaxID=1245417 RepID=UPI001BEBAC53|nr:DUF2252 family protein [Paraburkholderia strydomiana]MBT2795014.1 DUF2252 family protein [Paraburkholderia strydomiana]
MTKKSAKSARYPAPDARQPVLADIRRQKMASSPHAYERGTAAHFYAWVTSRSPGTLPEGPAVWICGDCHLGNLGPVADAAGEVAVHVRDLDQSVIGNPVHDLLRLGLSLATAARSSDLPGVITSRIAGALLDGYEQAFDDSCSDETSRTQRPKVVRIAMEEALHRSRRQLTRQNIDHVMPHIPLGKRFWPPSGDEKQAIHALVESGAPTLIRAVLSKEVSGESAIRILDTAYWVKGCSSLGRRRYAVLLDIDGACSAGGPPCLIDIKEAVAPIAPIASGHHLPRDNERRVVEGARHVTPSLGDRMMPARLDGCAVIVRELMPQDLKFAAEQISELDAVKAAHFLAIVIGQAHAGQMDAATRKAWLTELRMRRPKSSDAPSWLWRSIVELLVKHEAEYLDHCRRYALEKPLKG